MMKRMIAAVVLAAGLLSGCASLWPRPYPDAPAPPVPASYPSIRPNPDGGPPIFIPPVSP